jgi:hypothetical protein
LAMLEDHKRCDSRCSESGRRGRGVGAGDELTDPLLGGECDRSVKISLTGKMEATDVPKLAPGDVSIVVVMDANGEAADESYLPAVVTYLSRSRWSLAGDLELAPLSRAKVRNPPALGNRARVLRQAWCHLARAG